MSRDSDRATAACLLPFTVVYSHQGESHVKGWRTTPVAGTSIDTSVSHERGDGPPCLRPTGALILRGLELSPFMAPTVLISK